MKKKLALFIIFVIAFTLTGCNSKKPGEVNDLPPEQSSENAPINHESSEISPISKNPVDPTDSAPDDKDNSPLEDIQPLENPDGVIQSGDNFFSYADDGAMVPHPNKEANPADGTVVFFMGKYYIRENNKWILSEAIPEPPVSP